MSDTTIEPESAPVSDAQVEPTSWWKIKEQKTQALQEMNVAECPLPDNFELFYKIMHTRDRHGIVIDIRPFLTKDDAQLAVDAAIFDEKLERKYDTHIYSNQDKYMSTTGHFVADSTTQAKIYNYETNHETRHEVNIDVTNL